MILTIFTPTYNRRDKLLRLYESLKHQSCNVFEWLVVDDGSTDNTEELIDSLIKENKIKIKYVKQNNSGKHVAHNTALNYAEGDFFFCVDSDDWVKEGFIDKFVKEISNLQCHGVIAYKIDTKENLLSKVFPKQLQESSLFDLSYIYDCSGEFSIIIKTSIARAYKFPVFENEKFLGESVIYDQIGEKYKFRLMEQVATVCEYQEDGLTINYNMLMKQNPSGFCLYYMQRIDLSYSYIKKICFAGKYHCFKIMSKNKNLNYLGKNRILVCVTKPLGVLFWIYYKLIRGF